MLSEALVLIACATSHGCTETSNQYASENPDVVHRIEAEEKHFERMIGPETVNTIGPAVFFLAGGTSNIKLQESLYLQVNRQRGTLMLKKEFK